MIQEYTVQDHLPCIFHGRLRICVFAFAVLVFCSCNKLVEAPAPAASINESNVFTSDAAAISVMTGLYASLSNSQITTGNVTSMSFLPALGADELTLYPGSTSVAQIGYYQNALSAINTAGADFWTNIYPSIYVVNSAIEGLNGSTSLTPSIKQQLLGEAEFMRAFFYFYLVNLYGDVPLTTSSNYKANATLYRTPQTQVWAQIISDLEDAQAKLSPNYLDVSLLITTTERVRPTKWAATALLARSYLYNGNWSGADSAATAVIANNTLFNLDSLNGVFVKNRPESIWQLQPVQSGFDTWEGKMFILPTTGPSAVYPVYLSSSLLNSFEPGDNRKGKWISSVTVNGSTYYYAYKYKVQTDVNATAIANLKEYEVVLRLGEQYLIRAEAEANTSGGLNAAIADLNAIRQRANLPVYKGSIDQASVLNAIYHERQVELFTEWGHRLLDLKRTGLMDGVMGGTSGVCASKGGNWQSTDQLYPITQTQLSRDVNLVQNSGY